MTSISGQAAVVVAVPALLAGIALPLMLPHAREARVALARTAPAAAPAREVHGAALVRPNPRPPVRRTRVPVVAPRRGAVRVREAVPRSVAPRGAEARPTRRRVSHPPKVSAPRPHAQRGPAPHAAKPDGPKTYAHGHPAR